MPPWKGHLPQSLWPAKSGRHLAPARSHTQTRKCSVSCLQEEAWDTVSAPGWGTGKAITACALLPQLCDLEKAALPLWAWIFIHNEGTVTWARWVSRERVAVALWAAQGITQGQRPQTHGPTHRSHLSPRPPGRLSRCGRCPRQRQGREDAEAAKAGP